MRLTLLLYPFLKRRTAAGLLTYLFITWSWPDARAQGTGPTYLPSVPTVTFINPNRSGAYPDRFGWTVAKAGDVNGDGYADVLINAPNTYDKIGCVYLYLGHRRGISWWPSMVIKNPEPQPYDDFGLGLNGVGDINGDGYDDVLIGAWRLGKSNTGRVYVYLGNKTGLNATPDTILADPAAENGNSYGTIITGVGDVNQDGYADVVMGAPGTNRAEGRAYFYLGSRQGLPARPSTVLKNDLGAATGSFFGSGVAAAGDVNGDGFADVVVSAPGYGGIKRVHLFLGNSRGLDPEPSFTVFDPALSTGDFGSSVAGVGDVNGDGYNDVLVGDPKVESGKAYLYLGTRRPGLNPEPIVINAVVSSRVFVGLFGSSACAAGDVNHDGYADFLIGAPGVNNTGEAYLYLGSKAGPVPGPHMTMHDPTPGTSTSYNYFGGSVANVGDITQDGYDDLVIGSYGKSQVQGGAYVYLTNSSEKTLPPPEPVLQVSMYPNPAQAVVTVELPAVQGVTEASLALTNAVGQVVFTQRTSLPAYGTVVEIPVIGLGAGLYHLTIQTGKQRVSRSLVVE